MGEIAVLGWGSLIWDRRDLPVDLPEGHQWHPDGPVLPIEFARRSDKDRLTLVIWEEGGSPIQTRWARLLVGNLNDAVTALGERECIPQQSRSEFIGRCPSSSQSAIVRVIQKWAEAKNLEAVVWTALPPKWDGRNHLAPCLEDALRYLRALPEDKKADAEKYVRCAPDWVCTPYRDEFEKELGWKQRYDCDQSVIPADSPRQE